MWIDANKPVKFKQPNLDQRVNEYDNGPCKSLIDHFWDENVDPQQIAAGRAMERGDFAASPYAATIRRNPNRIQVQMTRAGNAWGVPLKITKGVTLESGLSTLEIAYLIEGLPPGRTFNFAIEFNIGGFAEQCWRSLFLER